MVVNKYTNLRLLIAVCICAAAFWPVWTWYVARIQDGGDEPLGLVALAVVAVVVICRRSELRLTLKGVVIAAMIMLVYGLTFAWLPSLVKGSLAIIALSCVLGVLHRQAGLVGLAALSLPIVASLQFYLGHPFRMVAAMMAEGLLSPFPFEITRTGTNLLLNGVTPVGVDPACSGIRMLWMGLFIGMSLATFKRLTWCKTIIVGCISLVGVLIGNGLRVTFLFVKESGLLALPEWTHEGIGLLIFLGLVLLLLWLIDRLLSTGKQCDPTQSEPRFSVGKISLVMFGALAILVATVQSFGLDQPSDKQLSEIGPEWPSVWDGHVLEPVPLTDAERAFSRRFPGKFGTFRAGYNTVILRWISRPTRQLHSSADCLRAVGYQIETEKPGRFIAIEPTKGKRFEVSELIYTDSGEQEWEEVSAWFWAASLKRNSGPWWATTVIRPLD